MHVVGTRFYNVIVHILIIFKTYSFFITSMLNRLVVVQVKVMYTHIHTHTHTPAHYIIISHLHKRTYAIILFYNRVFVPRTVLFIYYVYVFVVGRADLA